VKEMSEEKEDPYSFPTIFFLPSVIFYVRVFVLVQNLPYSLFVIFFKFFFSFSFIMF